MRHRPMSAIFQARTAALAKYGAAPIARAARCSTSEVYAWAGLSKVCRRGNDKPKVRPSRRGPKSSPGIALAIQAAIRRFDEMQETSRGKHKLGVLLTGKFWPTRKRRKA